MNTCHPHSPCVLCPGAAAAKQHKRGLKTTEVYPPRFWRCRRVGSFLEAVGEGGPVCASVPAPGCSSVVAASPHLCLCPYLHFFPLSLCLCLSLESHQSLDEGPIPIQYDLILTN